MPRHTRRESATPATWFHAYNSPALIISNGGRIHSPQLLHRSDVDDKLQSNALYGFANSESLSLNGLGIHCIKGPVFNCFNEEKPAASSMSTPTDEATPDWFNLQDVIPLHFSYSESSISTHGLASTDDAVSVSASSDHFSKLGELKNTSYPDLSSEASTDSIDAFFKYTVEGTLGNNSLDAQFSSSDSSTHASPERSMPSSSSVRSLQEILSDNSSPPVVPFVDLNMFSAEFSRQEPSEGVNPSDTLWHMEIHSPPLLPTSETLENDPLLESPTAGLPTSFVEGLKSLLESFSGIAYDSMPVVEGEHEHRANNPPPLPPAPPPSSSELQPRVVCSPETSMTLPPQVAAESPQPLRQKHAYVKQRHGTVAEVNNTSLEEEFCQTPVLNAHLGIDAADLEARAEKFRKRNPGQDLSRKWLESYAGKLSARGQLIEDYRCYVVGCVQRNKRRDHILIHIGSHLDQRPFRCASCNMRFLRKNECKRHEASHSGHRPFACDLCVGKKAFVRQDLLKRHLKRCHRIDDVEEKENWPRKRMKLEQE